MCVNKALYVDIITEKSNNHGIVFESKIIANVIETQKIFGNLCGNVQAKNIETNNLIASNVDIVDFVPPVTLDLIDEVCIVQCKCKGELEFQIIQSSEEGKNRAWVSPDVGTCKACQQEIMATGDRRYGYGFTNCTNCGLWVIP